MSSFLSADSNTAEKSKYKNSTNKQKQQPRTTKDFVP